MTQKKQTFEEALGALEALVTELEAGEMSLEKSLQAFEEGTKLVKACEAQLAEAEVKVEKILAKAVKL